MAIRVLVIEDDEEIADFVGRGLREEGFLVEVAADGLAGWHALQTASWDVVVLDWWLPGQDGLTLLRRYRRDGHDTPVLFLTARDAVSDRVQGLDEGADDYLCKPFAFTELIAWIHAETNLSELDAYQLLSQVGRVHLTEMVDPNYVIIAIADKKVLPPRKNGQAW